MKYFVSDKKKGFIFLQSSETKHKWIGNICLGSYVHTHIHTKEAWSLLNAVRQFLGIG